MKSSLLANAIAKLALTKKAHDVLVMDLRPLTSMTDFFVVCSADSETQIKAIADAVMEGTEIKGNAPWHKETGSSNWVLLDYSDVVLHIFHKNTRPYYNHEKLWGDAKLKKIQDKKPVASSRVRKTSRKPSSRRKTSAVRKKVA